MTRAQWCADHQHPGVTFNPWHDCTWCACGTACYPGDVARCGVVCCGGPLDVDRPIVDRADGIARRIAEATP